MGLLSCRPSPSFVDTGRGRYAYRAAGDPGGVSLVLLHGWPGRQPACLRIIVALGAVLAAALILTACAAPPDPSPSPPGLAPPRVPAPVPDPPPAPSAGRAAEQVVPDAALLQPEDLAGPRLSAVGPYAPPQPCAQPGYPSDGALLGSSAVEVYYRAPGVPADHIPTTRIQEYVALYRADGAEEFFADLNAALVRCPGTTSPWRVVDRGLAGEESLLIRVGPTNTGHTIVDRYVAVARSGPVVVVVADLGWEDTVNTTERVRSLLPVALCRAGIIHREDVHGIGGG